MKLKVFFKDFHDKYKHMPPVQQEDSQKQIAHLVDSQIAFTVELNIQSHKGRSLGSKKRKCDNSTTRDPSTFEIVQKTRKCDVCQGVGHNSRTCPRKVGDTTHSNTRGNCNTNTCDYLRFCS